MNFMFSSPTFVHFGFGIVKQLGNMLLDANSKKVFLVYDKGVKAAGLVQSVTGALEASGLEYREYDGVLHNPPDYQVPEASDLAV